MLWSGTEAPFITLTCAVSHTWLPITIFSDGFVLLPVAASRMEWLSPVRISMSLENIQSSPTTMLVPSVAARCPPSIVESCPTTIVLHPCCIQKEVLLMMVLPLFISNRFPSPMTMMRQLNRRALGPTIIVLFLPEMSKVVPFRNAPLSFSLLPPRIDISRRCYNVSGDISWPQPSS